MNTIKQFIKHKTTFHKANGSENVFLFSTPRSGSTWLTEIIASQPGFKMVKEPLNLRKEVSRQNAKLNQWEEILNPAKRQTIRDYFQWFLKGKDTDIRLRRPAPFSPFWKLRTNRVIFKILFGGEDYMDWFEEEFGGYYIFLLRHPIPVSISREEQPRLDSFMNTDYLDHYTPDQQRLARQIFEQGTVYERAVLDWVFQNSMPLRMMKPEWLLISYEQLVLEPAKVIQYMADKFGFSRPDLMMKRINKASASSGKSAQDSQKVLMDEKEIAQKRQWLVEKWKGKVTEEQVDATFNILEAFDIDHYQKGSFILNEKYLLT